MVPAIILNLKSVKNVLIFLILISLELKILNAEMF